jgi:hypothetical protein
MPDVIAHDGGQEHPRIRWNFEDADGANAAEETNRSRTPRELACGFQWSLMGFLWDIKKMDVGIE